MPGGVIVTAEEELKAERPNLLANYIYGGEKSFQKS
jgi:hypothetical protein